ncbi:Na+/Ca+ antiporter, CaCA family [Alkaliphilus metalliredigens QYMF]|uniref:Na+/Ca+ antiporter, CaCA family n=1 Tax=Alkaliphilus metalliredigens (strain QYMF) TaxID=293826 RepID=A6TQK1_ALKMQ|nr:calcium/sodium antiporter [Alkaliphilus metalliredigens]ABR48469.1 Na+/Ca+ antiporter, CaCA family [Alkaliphilus metalliredigens QYMF]
MGSWSVFFLFCMGLIMIIKGGDWFVESAVWVAKVTGVPNVLIGATIVSIATTLPELLVSVIATQQHYYDVAIGNVIGSMICNVGLILGLTTLFSPIKLNRSGFAIRGFFMLGSTALMLFFLRDRMISPREGTWFIVLFTIYILINLQEFNKNQKRVPHVLNQEQDVPQGSASKKIIMFIVGAVFIALGARLLVNNGVIIANILGVPEQVVSLTLIALGTSLPELTTAISSVVKGHQGISVGNILGANILDIVMVLGLSSKIGSQGIVISYQNVMLGATIYNIPQTLYLDLPVTLLMMGVLVFGGLLTGKINRVIGFLIFSIYGIYLIALAKLFM